MTKFTLGTVLAAMEVSVAVLAFIRSVREIEVGMAVAACHRGMAPTQRKACLGMVKPDLARDDLPIRDGVARPTWNIELAVRTLSRCHRPCRFRGHSAHR